MNRWLMLGLLVCACGTDNPNNNIPDGGGAGSGSISGTVGGQPLVVKDAVFAFDGNVVIVLVADRANICQLLASTTLPGTTTALLMSIANFVPPATVNPHVTGDYTFFPVSQTNQPSTAGLYWYGEFDVVDTSCAATANHVATAGTMSITQTGSSSGTHLKANLSGVQFGTDTLNGTFDASYCPVLANSSCGNLIARPPATE
ncbi:MAG TPA: hypothetical protein VFN91_16835 [Myxococcaceae bacterium]|nr:hypothetical protein [Myxococcaceae bacterium]